MSVDTPNNATIAALSTDILLSNDGRYGLSDEQLHFPWLYESPNGTWYMTYREGPHLEATFGPGNRVQCVQSRDRGATWFPWMGLEAEPFMRQLFVSQLQDGSLITYRCSMIDFRRQTNGRLHGTSIMLRSEDQGATWARYEAPVTDLPFSLGDHLMSLWGHAVELPDGTLLWACYSREGNSISGVVRSTDGGRSFVWLSDACTDNTVGQRRELGLARLASSELLGLIRCGTDNDRPMVAVRSDDDGQTWSDPLRLRAPGVCPQLLLLDNGVLVCSYGTRRNVHVMAGLDDQGREWSKPLVLYEGQTSGYTNLQSLDGDRFRVVHQEGSFDAHQPGGSRFVRTELLAKPGVISDAG